MKIQRISTNKPAMGYNNHLDWHDDYATSYNEIKLKDAVLYSISVSGVVAIGIMLSRCACKILNVIQKKSKSLNKIV